MSLKDSSTLLRLIEEDRAEEPRTMMTPFAHPALALLMMPRWDDAFGWLHHATKELLGDDRAQRLLDALAVGNDIRVEIEGAVDWLYSIGKVSAGEYALAWSLLTCSPARPLSFRSVLAQLQHALDEADLSPADDADVRERIRIWWRAAEGLFTKSKMSMFALVHAVLNDTYQADPEIAKSGDSLPAWFAAPYAGPTLVVMPKAKATKLNAQNKVFEGILDKPLQLVVARDLDNARKKLGYEFPHATGALQALFRDLREGQPVRVRPTILLGPPGVSKSRLVRKFAAAIGIKHVHRYDASGAGDNHFAGTSKSWSSTEASVPARAVLASRTANPIVMIDEIDKAASRDNINGSLYNALAGLLDAETSARFRDPSLDAELDLSAVGYLCTANDAVLPDFLRDRFRIVKVPAPRLVDLPLLAASVMEDLGRENDERAWDGPLATDELQVIAKAWEKAGFSLRQLQKIVRATLEIRDQLAMRH
jgi:hypothetical protein